MEFREQAAAIEAILFAMGDSVEISVLADALGSTVKEIEQTAKAMEEKYIEEQRGIRLMRYEDSLQLSTDPQQYPFLIKVAGTPKKQTLSQTVLETLSIVAYKQPVTRVEIEQIRGVNSDYAVNKLLGYDLICEAGRKDAPGKPLLFGTTEQFLRMFGINSIDELPQLDSEIEEEFKEESEQEVERRLGI